MGGPMYPQALKRGSYNGLQVGGKLRSRRRRGKGIADVLGGIPILGSLLGPIAKMFGGRIQKRKKRGGGASMRFVPFKGKGLANLHIRGIRRIYGGRLTPGSMSSVYQKLAGKGLGSRFAMPQFKKASFAPYRMRTAGLLAPAGRGMLRGGAVAVKGHYKYAASGKRVHVRPHIKGAGVRLVRKQTKKCGGYVPYRF